jgi:hypothetical protein
MPVDKKQKTKKKKANPYQKMKPKVKPNPSQPAAEKKGFCLFE